MIKEKRWNWAVTWRIESYISGKKIAINDFWKFKRITEVKYFEIYWKFFFVEKSISLVLINCFNFSGSEIICNGISFRTEKLPWGTNLLTFVCKLNILKFRFWKYMFLNIFFNNFLFILTMNQLPKLTLILIFHTTNFWLLQLIFFLFFGDLKKLFCPPYTES